MVYNVLMLMSRVCCLLPHRALLKLGKWLGILYFILIKKQRRLAIKHMMLSLKIEEDEAKKLVRKSFINMGRNFFEVLYMPALNKKNFTFEINKLVQALGGKDNILDYEVNMSRLKVTLKDISLADKDAIQRLGAKGIVEIENQLKIIFGSNAKTLKKYISEMK